MTVVQSSSPKQQTKIDIWGKINNVHARLRLAKNNHCGGRFALLNDKEYVIKLKNGLGEE